MKQRVSSLLCILLLTSAAAFARAEGHFDRTLTISGAVNFDLNTGSGSVTIRTGGANQVVIQGRVTSGDWWGGDADAAVRSVESNPPIEQNGGTIRVGYNLPEDAKHHVAISYEITLPPDTTLQVNTGSGDISAEGVRGSAKLHTGSGSIRARDLGRDSHLETGSGSIHADSVVAPLFASTGSGSIQAELTGSGDVDVHTGSGSIDVRGVNGALRARTGSGHIGADGSPKGAWQVQSGSGDVRLALGSAGGGFDMNLHTGSGSIHSDLPITVQGTMGKHELKGSVRGGGPEVEVSTGSGSIDIR
ncbi:MAG TPA: DUF4097 family beta strand repeat-containing protein [Candidatus Angelobacter sp.]|jgi:DUF4097 and DUF4098 domain-containing protein YvlB|nr:DUF4097 family beta strand repeat-containing protein [Candidatus Angelobacter sp.]